MKTINVTFEDLEYEKLLKEKGEMNWRDFVLTLTNKKAEKNKIYKSIIALCEEIEQNKTYSGNGHHLAQKITEAIILEDPMKNKEK